MAQYNKNYERNTKIRIKNQTHGKLPFSVQIPIILTPNENEENKF